MCQGFLHNRRLSFFDLVFQNLECDKKKDIQIYTNQSLNKIERKDDVFRKMRRELRNK